MQYTHWDEPRNYPRLRRASAAQAIADHIRRRIVRGDLRIGRRLPSVPRLAEMHGVSRATIQSALHILRAIGFVESIHGVGTFVARPKQHGAALNHAWLMADPVELGRARYFIDRLTPPMAALLAAKDADRVPAPIRALPFLAMEIDRGRHAWPEELVTADATFHREIAASLAGNEAAAAIRQLVTMRLQPLLVVAAEHQRTDDRLMELHRDLAGATLDGRATESARLGRAVARRELAILMRTATTR